MPPMWHFKEKGRKQIFFLCEQWHKRSGLKSGSSKWVTKSYKSQYLQSVYSMLHPGEYAESYQELKFILNHSWISLSLVVEEIPMTMTSKKNSLSNWNYLIMTFSVSKALVLLTHITLTWVYPCLVFAFLLCSCVSSPAWISQAMGAALLIYMITEQTSTEFLLISGTILGIWDTWYKGQKFLVWRNTLLDSFIIHFLVTFQNDVFYYL